MNLSRHRMLAAAGLPPEALAALCDVAPGVLWHAPELPVALVVRAVGHLETAAAVAIVQRHLPPSAAPELLAAGERRPAVVTEMCTLGSLPSAWQHTLVQDPTLAPALHDREWLDDEILLALAGEHFSSFMLSELGRRAERLSDAQIALALSAHLGALSTNLGLSARLSLLVRDRPSLRQLLGELSPCTLALARVVPPGDEAAELAEHTLARLGSEPGRRMAAVLISRSELDVELRSGLHAALFAVRPELCGLWRLVDPARHPTPDALQGGAPDFDPFTHLDGLLRAATTVETLDDAVVAVHALGELGAAIQQRAPGWDALEGPIDALYQRHPGLVELVGPPTASRVPAPTPRPLLSPAGTPQALVREPFGGARLEDLDAMRAEHAPGAWAAAAAYLRQRLEGPHAASAWLVACRLLDAFPGTVAELAGTALASVGHTDPTSA